MIPSRNKRTALLGIALVGVCTLPSFQVSTGPLPALAPVECGIDRSNMGTEWTLAWPSEPDVSPFLASEYNDPGDFEARRIAVFNGLARLHPK